MSVRTTILCSALACLVMYTGVSAGELVVDRIIAVVNDEIVTQYELEDRLRPINEQIKGKVLSPEQEAQIQEIREKALKSMVDDMLLEQEAERYNITVSEAEVKAEVDRLKESHQWSEQDFKRQLALEGFSEEDFLDDIRRGITKHRLIGHMVQSKVVITDSEIEQEFKSRQGEFVKGKFVRLRLILLPPEASAPDLAKDIKDGKMSFAEAADKYSQGPGAGQGGDIGTLAWKDLAPEWRNALDGLSAGQVTEPFEVNETNVLLMLEAAEEGESQEFTEVKEEIYAKLYKDRLDKIFKEYMEQLRRKAVIDYR